MEFDEAEKCLNDLLEFEYCQKQLEEINKLRLEGKLITDK
jgi:hypothetical protein